MGHSRGAIVRHLAGLPNVGVEDRPEVLLAVGHHGAGLDFADALHLVRSIRCDRLATFDRGFAGRARRLGARPEVVVP